jgi:repressor LexA
MSIKLTKKQQIVLDYLKKFVSFKGEAPTLTEIMDALDISTKRGVVQYLEALEKKGKIKRSSEARGIKIIKEFQNGERFVKVPLVGYSDAGTNISFKFEDTKGSIQIDKELIPEYKKLYALQMKSDALNKQRIKHIRIAKNNYLIISRQEEIYDGESIVAEIDGEIIARNIRRYANQIILYPNSDNPIYKPIYLHEDSEELIRGKIISVLDNNSFKLMTQN